MSHTIKHDGWAMIFSSDLSGNAVFVPPHLACDEEGCTACGDAVPGELIRKYTEQYVNAELLDALRGIREEVRALWQKSKAPDSHVIDEIDEALTLLRPRTSDQREAE